MKKKIEINYCSFCGKEYKAEVWGKVSIFNLTKSHNCEEQRRVEQAKKELYSRQP